MESPVMPAVAAAKLADVLQKIAEEDQWLVANGPHMTLYSVQSALTWHLRNTVPQRYRLFGRRGDPDNPEVSAIPDAALPFAEFDDDRGILTVTRPHGRSYWFDVQAQRIDTGAASASAPSDSPALSNAEQSKWLKTAFVDNPPYEDEPITAEGYGQRIADLGKRAGADFKPSSIAVRYYQLVPEPERRRISRTPLG
jgi:hypothetical protein